jgi:acetoin utilization deacetylase AcuC-like enzyme
MRFGGEKRADGGGPPHRLRKLVSRLRAPRVELVYGALYQVDLPGIDALRGERILSFLGAAGLLAPGAVHEPEPAELRALRRVHTDDYLESLGHPGALLPILGLELPDHAAERVIEAQRAMVGGTMLAARLALERGGIAASLGGGLHHAFADKGERFCLFNDVAVAIAELRDGGFAEPVLVVDLDLHDGDGTRSIFARDPSVHTLSIHHRVTRPAGSRRIRSDQPSPADGTQIIRSPSADEPAVASTSIELPDGLTDAAYLEELRAHLMPLCAGSADFRPGLVIYLAGCDVAADDAIGNWRLSAAGVLARDRLVVDCARAGGRRLPLVVLLAGGYGQNAWRYSARFLSTLRRGGRPVEPPSTAESTLARYRRLTHVLHPRDAGGRREARAMTAGPAGSGNLPGVPPMAGAAAARDADWGLTPEDIHAALGGPVRPRRLLGYLSRQAIELILERAGLFDRLRRLGFRRPTLDLELDDLAGDTVRIFGDPDRGELLAEMRLRIDRHTAAGMALLRIEWLRLQNPRARFTVDIPRLPGQDHPGLGMLRDFIALLIVACEKLQLDGLLWVPAYYYTAAQAAQSKASMRFLDPRDEGLYRALEESLRGLSLVAATQAIDQGRVMDAAGQPFSWRPAPMAEPVSGRFRRLLESDDYRRAAAAAAAEHTFRLAGT